MFVALLIYPSSVLYVITELVLYSTKYLIFQHVKRRESWRLRCQDQRLVVCIRIGDRYICVNTNEANTSRLFTFI